MKTNWVIVILIIVFFSVLYAVNFYGKNVPKLPLANTKLYNEDSTEFLITALKNQVVVISFFQTWCGDCRAEVKELANLQEAVGGSEKLKVYLITDEQEERLSVFRAATHAKFPILHTEISMKNIGIRRFPTTYLLDKNGKIIDAKVEGIRWNTPEVQAEINALNR
ncbi:MAG TPA: TlpA disulfide reductase family protein [Chitinophagales bacterium]|nr:TlpA disulfide reductase family protein [Chitinophagales bacterium]HNM32551.1 TlpA disulfide reductase family protein [Chitinophagales bacterium]